MTNGETNGMTNRETNRILNPWDTLKNPPAAYRSVPLWSWNDLLEKEELERQIEEMHRAGIGGFFMHARGGLQTPYMGEEWMEAIRTSIEKSRELGMNAWFYDENGWPSGFADGKVPAKGLDYQQKRLVCEQAPFEDVPAERIIGWDAAGPDGGADYRLLPPGEEARADLRISYDVNPYYTDTLSSMAVKEFIDSTYERYWKQFGEKYGGELSGIFTDEPQFGRGALPWSFELEDMFIRRHGGNVKEVLPALFLDTMGASRARYAYWETVTFMFTQAYAKQIGDWCAGKGWSATGHVVDEQELMHQVTSVGDPMAFYEHLQIPGCDWLGRFVGNDAMVPKQVSSVARQLGKKRAITESFGCSGWNVSFADLKRIGEWQFVHGINLLCQHLQGYSLRGLRKRDYPPSLFYQQPWWSEYKNFNDYFARLSLLLSEGAAQAEVLLLHPVRTAWTLQRGGDYSAVIPYHEAFARLTRWLCQSLIEHDYGSEGIIAGHGRVSGGSFIVGEAAYRVVIVPPSVTVDRRTAELLREFSAQGGTLIAFEPYPVLVDGQEDAEFARFMEAAVLPEWSCEALCRAVSAGAGPSLQISGGNGEPVAADTLNVRTLELAGSILHYVVNSGTEFYPLLNIQLTRQGTVSLVDLETGEIRPLEQKLLGRDLMELEPLERDQMEQELLEQELPEQEQVQAGQKQMGQKLQPQGVRLQLPLHPGQSYMLKVDPFTGSAPITGDYGSVREQSDNQERSPVELAADWEIVHADLNSLTLDNARLRVDGGEWSELQPVIFIQEQLLAYGRTVTAELEFAFAVGFDTARQRELYLVIERPEELEVELNGARVETAGSGWWRDISFRTIDISGLAAAGRNTLVLRMEFHSSQEIADRLARAKAFEAEGNKLTIDQELESIYLLGDFGVHSGSGFTDGERRAVCTEGPFQLMEPARQVQTGDLTRQGFPFFSGSLRLRQTLELDAARASGAQWFFQSPPDAIVTKLFINGAEVRSFLWEPYDADISSFLHSGSNVIELELTGSCRNLLGPHHHIKGEVYKVGPDSYKDKPGWTDKDLDKDTHVYQTRYAFVKFGLAASPLIYVEQA
ncbi:glycosyl hydrolase [Paenibacillus riograndensis]|uniref:glycosyl hydrolase n=1 Tax=Paenibacillus riograndensis TaxID=483937 RepID=UPI0002ECA185|nr:glycosyl hydrolase [Paenibacillus riograndensis]